MDLKTLLDGAGTASQEDRDRLVDGWELIRDLSIRVSDTRDLGEISRISRQHVGEGGKLIIVDQLSMIHVEDAAVGFEAATITSNTLRLLAR